MKTRMDFSKGTTYYVGQKVYQDTVIFKSHVVFEKGFTIYKRERDYDKYDIYLVVLVLLIFVFGVIVGRISKMNK